MSSAAPATSPTVLLPPDLLAMMERGISVIAGSCDALGRPSIMRAVGSALGNGGQTVTIFLSRRQSRQLLLDVQASGHIAVVFSEPSTHRTVQLKAARPVIRQATQADVPGLARYLKSMEHEIAQVGHPPRVTRAMLAWSLDDLVALSFEPSQAFDQTPGPRAGAALTTGAMPAGTGSPRGAPIAPPAPVASDPTLPLGAIRACLEGAVPAMMATSDEDSVPNVAYISQVYYVDERHVALSFQFFNKTRQNILVRPWATVLVIDPHSATFYRLQLRYLRTETEGALFEGMKAQLAGIASHSGMAGVFQLRGSDVYEVREIERVPGDPLPLPPARAGLLGAVRRASERLARATALDDALNAVLSTLADHLGMRHAMVLMLDAATGRLYTVASCGYATSGVGSEIEMGDGVIGVAAREQTPVRIMHMTNAYLYSHAIRRSLRADEPELALATDIPYPGLPEPHSQLAVPVLSAGRLLGVLFAESPQDMQFSYEDEDALVAIAGHLGAAMDLMQAGAETAEPAAPATALPTEAAGVPLVVRRYPANDSVFIDGTYLIKGVAGAIFWKLLGDHAAQGRTEFTNRELRLDPAIRLPDVADNLEARLVLLQRRLAEHGPHIRIEKTGRGRFRLAVMRPVELAEVAG